MRVATFAKQTGRTVSFSLAAFRQAFAAGKDLTEPDNVMIAAAACELHPRALRKRGQDARASKTRCARRPTRPPRPASSASPRCGSASEVFWGDDRLEEAVRRPRSLKIRATGAWLSRAGL